MVRIATLRPIARNRFMGNKDEKFQPVSLDDILDMLVSYEGPQQRNPSEESAEISSKASFGPDKESRIENSTTENATS